LQVISVEGSVVYGKKVGLRTRNTVDLSGIAKGVYILKMSTPKEIYRRKIIKQ